MAISVFDTRTMLEALEMLREPKTFLLNTFFKGQNEFPTESVDIDIYKGKRRVAVYVNPKGAGQVVDRTGYKTNTYKPPYVKPKCRPRQRIFSRGRLARLCMPTT